MGSDAELLAAFLRAAPPQASVAAPEQLGAALRAMLNAGRTAHPRLAVDGSDFAAFLAERAEGAELPAARYAADLYLACACVRRVAGAEEVFSRALAADIERAVRRVSSDPAFVDEVRQAVEERLLLGEDGGVGKLAGYGGRAALVTWVHVAATRLALNQKEKDKGAEKRRAHEKPDALIAGDAELELLKRRYAPEFEAALHAAVRRISESERELLRGHFLQQMTVDDLGERLGVSRATAARRLAAARAAVLEATQAELKAKLRLSQSELVSLAGLVRSRIDVSLAGLLGK